MVPEIAEHFTNAVYGTFTTLAATTPENVSGIIVNVGKRYKLCTTQDHGLSKQKWLTKVNGKS